EVGEPAGTAGRGVPHTGEAVAVAAERGLGGVEDGEIGRGRDAGEADAVDGERPDEQVGRVPRSHGGGRRNNSADAVLSAAADAEIRMDDARRVSREVVDIDARQERV